MWTFGWWMSCWCEKAFEIHSVWALSDVFVKVTRTFWMAMLVGYEWWWVGFPERTVSPIEKAHTSRLDMWQGHENRGQAHRLAFQVFVLIQTSALIPNKIPHTHVQIQMATNLKMTSWTTLTRLNIRQMAGFMMTIWCWVVMWAMDWWLVARMRSKALGWFTMPSVD